MNKTQFDEFAKELTKNGYKRIDPTVNSRGERIETSQRPYWWKTVVYRPDSYGDMRAVVMITYDIYDYSQYEQDEQYQYSYLPAINISRDYDDWKLDTPKLSIKELEEFAVKFFDFVEQNIPSPK